MVVMDVACVSNVPVASMLRGDVCACTRTARLSQASQARMSSSDAARASLRASVCARRPRLAVCYHGSLSIVRAAGNCRACGGREEALPADDCCLDTTHTRLCGRVPLRLHPTMRTRRARGERDVPRSAFAADAGTSPQATRRAALGR